MLRTRTRHKRVIRKKLLLAFFHTTHDYDAHPGFRWDTAPSVLKDRYASNDPNQVRRDAEPLRVSDRETLACDAPANTQNLFHPCLPIGDMLIPNRSPPLSAGSSNDEGQPDRVFLHSGRCRRVCHAPCHIVHAAYSPVNRLNTEKK